MQGEKPNHLVTPRGFMGALARDVRGNTLAIMAAALIPLAGLVGGGIDISRMYITKTRLQHACDAGALAGRKAMGGGVWGSDDNATAQQFFNANFSTNAYGSNNLQESFSENAGKVSGTASAVLPMTLMRIFGQTTHTLSVSCDAEMRLPNTDVMFVLDNSGSMGDKAVSSDDDTKIQSLRTSVKCFYEIVARLPTNATCTTAKPSGGTGTQVQIRFGFVNYSTNVNVGKLLPTSYFPDSWTYQTRQANYTPVTTYTFPNPGTAQVTSAGYVNSNTGNYSSYSSVSATSSGDCASKVPANTNPTLSGSEGSPQNVRTNQSGSTQTSTWYTLQSATYYTYSGSYTSGRRGSSGTCTIKRAQVSADYQRNYSRSDAGVPQITQVFSNWTYGALPVNISGLKNGTSWNSSITVPIGSNGSDKTITWSGCIEERHTVPGTNFSPIPSGANDLDIDTVPVAGSIDTEWKPALPGLIYLRNNGSSYTTSSVTTTSNFSQPGADCPTESRKLQAWTDPTVFDSYVDSLVPTVNTYHDIGLLWGARFLSPTGIFASENALTQPTADSQGGGEIERHLIFMTDGDTQTSTSDYAAYGIPWYDRRNVTASDVGNSPGATNMNDQVNARFAALCTAIKNKNITLWVISFGSGSNSTTETRLSNCATSGRYFTARSSAALQSTFASIANQISQLRLTK